MNVHVKEIENIDFDHALRLVGALYLELGEDVDQVSSLAKKFLNNLVCNELSTTLVVKNFITNEIVTLATLTESKAIFSSGKYGVLDEIYTLPKCRSMNGELNFKDEIKEFAIGKGWGRIDVASPTDAWYRTVRFYRNQAFRLTVPKFKYIVDLAGAA